MEIEHEMNGKMVGQMYKGCLRVQRIDEDV